MNHLRSTRSGYQTITRNSRSLRIPAHGTARIFQQIPSLTLQPFVDSFVVVEFPPHHDDAHLPDVRPVAAFSFRGRCRMNRELWAPSAGFTGPRGTLRYHEHSDGHSVLLATFTAVGAAAFLPAPLEEFRESTVDLSGVLGRPEELEQLREQITDAPSHALRVELLERFLLSRLRVASPDPLVSAAVDWLRWDSQAKRISQLARYVGLSQSALERRFRKIVGISPKRFTSIVRLRRAVHLRSSGANLTLAAHSAGYFDQSHFIRFPEGNKQHARSLLPRISPGIERRILTIHRQPAIVKSGRVYESVELQSKAIFCRLQAKSLAQSFSGAP